MSNIQHKSGPNSAGELYKQIESIGTINQVGWRDLSSTQSGYESIIAKANSSIDIVDFLDAKLNLESLHSSSGWSYRTYCPFHKGGNERTPSFFINQTNNRFYCQACSVSGGIVEFISKKYRRPVIIVAEHILNCVNGKITIDEERIKKINDKKRFNELLLKLSDICRNFATQYIDDEPALLYLNKLMMGFDNVISKNPDGIERSMDDIFNQFKQYLDKYNK